MFGTGPEISIIDILILGLGLGIGGFTFINPKKSWHLFQSKKLKDHEPDEKSLKTTKYFGGFIALISLVSIIVEFFR